jgi:F0F1-type ATP synthase delta subunit
MLRPYLFSCFALLLFRRNLFAALADHGRLGETEKVIDGFLELMSAHRGEIEVIITSASVSTSDV